MHSVMIRFGWYCLKRGTGVIHSTGTWRDVERCAVRSSGAGASGDVVTIVELELREHEFDLFACGNGTCRNAVCPYGHIYEVSIACVQDLVEKLEDVDSEVRAVEERVVPTMAVLPSTTFPKRWRTQCVICTACVMWRMYLLEGPVPEFEDIVDKVEYTVRETGSIK